MFSELCTQFFKVFKDVCCKERNHEKPKFTNAFMTMVSLCKLSTTTVHQMTVFFMCALVFFRNLPR